MVKNIEPMPNNLLKFIRLKNNAVVIFSRDIQHSTFKSLNPVSAGFCMVDSEHKKVLCTGESVSLELKSDEQEDSEIATLQVFGQYPKFDS
jgi:hypothetical protein